MKRIFAFLREDSKVSTTRVVSFLAIVGTLILIGCICFNIFYRTINCADVSWTEISAFIGSLGAFNGVFMYGKVKQKNFENQKLSQNGQQTTNSDSETSGGN